jgi:hypothetical protein
MVFQLSQSQRKPMPVTDQAQNSILLLYVKFGSMLWKNEKYAQSFGPKTYGKRPLARPRCS